MGVVGLVYGTSSNAFYNVDAALTPPTNYHLNYRQFNGKFRLGGSSGGSDILGYQRTADGIYYNYSNTFDNIENALIPLGMEIKMTFNRSNVGNWTAVGTPPNVVYQPWDSYIGSDATVGSKIGKVDLTFDNQTSRNYQLYVDTSSMTELFFRYYVNDVLWDIDSYYFKNTTLTNILLPSYTKLRLELPETSGARYFDAWYLQDLGVSDSYDQGFDDGYLDGYDDALTDGGIFGIFTAVFSAMATFLSIELFAEITLGTVLLFPMMFGILFFILRVIRGQ